MRTIEEIQAEIDELWEKVNKATEFIAILREVQGRVTKKKEDINSDIYNPFKLYDMTRASKWRGDRECEAADLQADGCVHLQNSQKSTANLLDEIAAEIERLEKCIEEWKKRIEHLEAEKDELENLQDNGDQETQ